MGRPHRGLASRASRPGAGQQEADWAVAQEQTDAFPTLHALSAARRPELLAAWTLCLVPPLWEPASPASSKGGVVLRPGRWRLALSSRPAGVLADVRAQGTGLPLGNLGSLIYDPGPSLIFQLSQPQRPKHPFQEPSTL